MKKVLLPRGQVRHKPSCALRQPQKLLRGLKFRIKKLDRTSLVLRCLRPGPTQTRLYNHTRRLEASNFGSRKKRDYTISVAKTKALIRLQISDLGRRGIILSV